jgi:hypothetical protein
VLRLKPESAREQKQRRIDEEEPDRSQKEANER